MMNLVVHLIFNHIVIRNYSEDVGNGSRMVAVWCLIDLIDTRDTFRHSASFLSFNDVCEITVCLAKTKDRSFFKDLGFCSVIYPAIGCVCLFIHFFSFFTVLHVRVI